MKKVSKKARYSFFVNYFSESMPIAETELSYKSDYELLVAVILSAQCTDKRVNTITPVFFKRFPSPKSLAKARQEQIYETIKSCSYPNNKAQHLLGMAKMLVKDFKGRVPDTLEEMIKLPGVGRKTANVMLAVMFNKPAMPVDTHVFRVAARIGLATDSKTPEETERQLVSNLDADKLALAHHWLILHGRYVCQARKPKCYECGMRPVCNFYIAWERNEKSGI